MFGIQKRVKQATTFPETRKTEYAYVRLNVGKKNNSVFWWNSPLQDPDPSVQNLQAKLDAALREIENLKGGSSTTNTPSPASRPRQSTPSSALTSRSDMSKGSRATRMKDVLILSFSNPII